MSRTLIDVVDEAGGRTVLGQVTTHSRLGRGGAEPRGGGDGRELSFG